MCWNQKMSKNQDNKAHTVKPLNGGKKMIYCRHKQQNDILSHQADEELCAQNLIVFFFSLFFSQRAFSKLTLLHVTVYRNTKLLYGLHLFTIDKHPIKFLFYSCRIE